MPNNIITKEWVDANDAAIQKNLQPLKDVKVVRVLSEAPQSWESLLTYTISNNTYSFKPGDEVRVPDNNSNTGYSYYKLCNISNGEATWAKGSSNIPNFKATVIVTLEAYANNIKTSGSDLTGAVVTLTNSTTSQSTTKTLAAGDTSVTFTDVEPLVNYTVSVSSTGNYTAPEAQTLNDVSLGATVYLTFGYFADEYTFDITSNQTNDTVIGAVVGTVSYTGGSQTSHSSVKVAAGTEVTITFPDVTGYKKTITNVGKAYTVSYQTEIVYVTLATETDADISEATFTIKDGSNNTLGTGESGDSVKIPYDTTYTVSASVLSGYQAEDASYTASQTTRNVTLNYIEEIKGVYAYYSDGSLRDLEHADSDAIGVAVVDDACSFVIDKIDSGGYILPYGQDLTNCGILTSRDPSLENSDFQGYHNTTILKGYIDYNDAEPSNFAAYKCRARFNNKGYLPALSELYTAYLLKEEVNAMISAIGGIAFTSSDYLTSTLQSTSDNAPYFWSLNWQDGSTKLVSTLTESNSRAFSTIPLSVTLTLSSSDGTSIANREILIVDKTEEPKIVTSDSTGRVSATVAIGGVDIRVKGCHTLTKHIVLNSNTRNITVEIHTPDPGIYAYYADGTMRDYDNADSTAVGVAVVTSNCSFVMAKNSTNLSSPYFGGYRKDLSDTAMTTTDATIAKTDFNGESNTINIFNACAGYTYNNITGSPVTYRCRTQYFYEGVRGYVGSLGEWYTAYQNKSSIDSMFEKIGGGLSTAYPYYFWTSTHGNTLNYTWVLYWSTGSTACINRDQYGKACVFWAL